MIVETYEVTEATTEGRDSYEIEAEALALIETLGLEGQRSLVVEDEDDASVKTRIPYQKMTALEAAVYGTVYPQATGVERYSAGPIPLRVLQVIAHARTLFEKVVIWHPKEYDPDPVLVGINGEYSKEEVFLLARWGDALAPFEELQERARARIEDDFRGRAEEAIAKCQGFLASPRASVEKALRGESQWEPWTR